MRRLLVVSLAVATAAVGLLAPAAGAARQQPGYSKLLLTRADVPTGWQATAADTEADQTTAKAIAKCEGMPLVKKAWTVQGRDLTSPAGDLNATSSIAVYDSPAKAKKQFAAYTSSKFDDCAQKHFESTPVGGAGGPLPTSVAVQPVTVDEHGDKAVAYGARADIPQGDTSVTVTSVQVAVLRGKAIARYQFNAQGDVFDQATAEGMLAKIDARGAKAKL